MISSSSHCAGNRQPHSTTLAVAPAPVYAELVARLGLAGWWKKNVNIVNAAIRHLRRERKGCISCNKKVVASIVLQFERVTTAGYQANDRTANGESRLRACNLYIRDVPAHSAGAVRDKTGLCRNRGLSQYGDGVRGTSGYRRWQCKRKVTFRCRRPGNCYFRCPAGPARIQ